MLHDYLEFIHGNGEENSDQPDPGLQPLPPQLDKMELKQNLTAPR